MAQWFLAAKKADFDEIGRTFGISPVLARLIRNRDIVGTQEIRKYLEGTAEDMYDAGLLKDMDKAVELLHEKTAQGKKIRIIGDYDVDGICSAFILLKGLKLAGADVDAAIPHRIKDGYGLNEGLIQEAAEAGVDTVLTCDNGISAAAQTAYAVRLGMTVLITDHHEVPYEETDGEKKYLLPGAAAAVDPKRADCAYPFKGICGAVVAYKLMQSYFSSCTDTPEAVRQAYLEEMTEFAAFATICDVMELKDENRILVKQGLKYMENTKNMGLKALLQVNGLEGRKITPYHIGFVLGPCLNATGRLDTAERALDLLGTDKWEEAVRLAQELKDLNETRKDQTQRGVRAAVDKIEASSLKEDRILVLYLPECHESLAGIIAGRLKEQYGRPAFVLTKGEEGVKGSGRSVEAYHMYENMTRCAGFFTKFGGHKLAAGLSMKEEDIEPMRKFLNDSCTLTQEDLEEKVHIDIALPLSYINEAFVEELSLLEPFGTGNPKPLFAQKNIKILSEQIYGKNKNVGKYRAADEAGGRYELTYFGDTEAFREYYTEKERISVTYYPSFNEYMGKRSVQIVIQNYQ